MPDLLLKRTVITENDTLLIRGVSAGITNRGTATVRVNGEDLETNESISLDGFPGCAYNQEFTFDFNTTGTKRVVVYVNQITV